jgi:hypothetical protein
MKEMVEGVLATLGDTMMPRATKEKMDRVRSKLWQWPAA